MTIQIGTDDCEPGTVAGLVHDEFEALYGVGPAGSATVKGVAFSIAKGVVEGLRTQIADGEAVGRAGSNLAGLEVDGGGGAGAPSDATYVTATSNGTLSAERVATTTATVAVDIGTAGQMKWSVASIAGVTGLSATAQTPASHASSHQNGGGDEVSVAGLSGLLADGQTPLAHKTAHENGGSDEISVAGLSGLLADNQNPTTHATSHQDGGSDELNVTGLAGLLVTPQTPAAHKTSHENGGADEISVLGLSGLLGDAQTPLAHKTSHENGGSDELSVAGLSGLLADNQNPLAHKTSHQAGGTDAIQLDNLATPDDNADLNATTGYHGLLPKLDGSTGKFLSGGGTWITVQAPEPYLDVPISFSQAVTSGVAFNIFETVADFPEGFSGVAVFEYYAWGGSAASPVVGHTTGSRISLRRSTGGNLAVADGGQTAALGEGTGWTPSNAANAQKFRVQLTITTTTTIYVRGWYRVYGAVLA